MMVCLKSFVLFALSLMIMPIYAHQTSTSFIDIQENSGSVSMDLKLPIIDLHYKLDLDINMDGNITWDEIKLSKNSITQFVAQHVSLSFGDTHCPYQQGILQLESILDMHYLVIPMDTMGCKSKDESLSVLYTAFFDMNSEHRALLKYHAGEVEKSLLFTPTSTKHEMSKTRHSTDAFWSYISEGIWHIYVGYDHILFLLSLLFTSVLVRQAG